MRLISHQCPLSYARPNSGCGRSDPLAGNITWPAERCRFSVSTSRFRSDTMKKLLEKTGNITSYRLHPLLDFIGITPLRPWPPTQPLKICINPGHKPTQIHTTDIGCARAVIYQAPTTLPIEPSRRWCLDKTECLLEVPLPLMHHSSKRWHEVKPYVGWGCTLILVGLLHLYKLSVGEYKLKESKTHSVQ